MNRNRSSSSSSRFSTDKNDKKVDTVKNSLYSEVMFVKLTDFKRKRTGREAFGFYLAYLVLIVLAAAIAGGLFGAAAGGSNRDLAYETGQNMGTIVAVAVCLYLSFTVLTQKKLTKNFGFILVGLLSGLLAVLGGGALGLIPVAFLTTK